MMSSIVTPSLLKAGRGSLSSLSSSATKKATASSASASITFGRRGVSSLTCSSSSSSSASTSIQSNPTAGNNIKDKNNDTRKEFSSVASLQYQGMKQNNIQHNLLHSSIENGKKNGFTSSSRAASSSSGGISGWFENRKERKEQENYMDQMQRLSDMDMLTLENYHGELKRGLSSWAANISMLQTKEVKIAKETVEMVDAFMIELGKDAGADELLAMDRMQRLRVATACNKSLEDIGIMIAQIQNMDLMQRTLKKRKEEGKSIPPDPQSMQAAIKKDALEIMTPSQKKLMKTRSQEFATRMARRKR